MSHPCSSPGPHSAPPSPAVELAQGSLASIGFVSVFGAAARAAVATVVLAAELFGLRAIMPAAVAATAGLTSRGRGGLYEPEGGPTRPVGCHQI